MNYYCNCIYFYFFIIFKEKYTTSVYQYKK